MLAAIDALGLIFSRSEASELVDDGATVPGGLHSFSHDRDPFQDDSLASKLVQSGLKVSTGAPAESRY